MKSFLGGLRLIVTRNDSRIVVILATVLFFLVLLCIQNGKAAFDVFSFASLSFGSKMNILFSTLFDFKSTFTKSALTLAILGSVIGGVNVALAYTYVMMRGEIILKSGLYSGLGLVLAFLGVGCAACGTAFLSVVLGFFGFGAVLTMLPYKGEELGYLGIFVLCVATYTLAKKVTTPGVC